MTLDPVPRRLFVRSSIAAAVGLFRLRTAAAEPFRVQLGYAAITWEGKDEQAIEDIAAQGFHGIQLRSSVLPRWGAQPEKLRRMLEEKRLALLCFSSGSVDALPEKENEYLETHVENARFVAALNGKLIQVISRRPRDGAPTPEEFARLGKLLSELGRRTQDVGVRLVYHNHMNAFGESPDEVARVLDLTEPRYVSLLLDVAHYQQGGGDPVAAVSRHRDRLAILHLKDVVSPLPGDTRPARQSYRWVELGKGCVDLPGVMAALRKIQFNGPAIIELDAVPEPGRTPADCAAANKKYAQETLGLSA